MEEIDLTDYVLIGAKAAIDVSDEQWNQITQDVQFEVLETVLPVVAAVLIAYKKNNEKDNYDFLGGIG